nr:cytochrome P450 [Tanacetum cinerariifolium]
MREYKDQTGSFGNPDKFIKDTLLSLLVAGRDTTSSALTGSFYLLAKNPLVEGKIREEIHEKLGMKEGEKWKSFGSEDLEKLAYLQGRRSCIGKEFSLIQMKIVAATMIYNYDIELVEGYPRTQNASVFVQLKCGLIVKLNRRNEGICFNQNFAVIHHM